MRLSMRSFWLPRLRLRSVCCGFILLFSATKAIGATVYTDQSTFLSNVQPGYYLETFDSLPQPFVAPPLQFSSNGFNYTADTPDDLFYTIGGALSTDHQAFDIVFSLTSNNITALGASFGLGGPFLGQPFVSVRLDDGTVVSLPPLAAGFIGFTTTSPIQSLTLSAPAGGFATANDFIAGAAMTVPEGSVRTLLAMGVAGLLAHGIACSRIRLKQ